MGLLISLNEEGYSTLKNDREAVLLKIEELKKVLDELDNAYNHLKPYYEPDIEISISKSRNENIYVGVTNIPLPEKALKKKITFGIGSVENYKDLSDYKLIEDAKREAREHISKILPTYFE